MTDYRQDDLHIAPHICEQVPGFTRNCTIGRSLEIGVLFQVTASCHELHKCPDWLCGQDKLQHETTDSFDFCA